MPKFKNEMWDGLFFRSPDVSRVLPWPWPLIGWVTRILASNWLTVVLPWSWLADWPWPSCPQPGSSISVLCTLYSIKTLKLHSVYTRHIQTTIYFCSKFLDLKLIMSEISDSWLQDMYKPFNLMNG